MDCVTFQHRCAGLLYDSIERIGFQCISSSTNDSPFLFHNLAVCASPLSLLVYQFELLEVAAGFRGIGVEDLKPGKTTWCKLAVRDRPCGASALDLFRFIETE
uniref:Uncharacterized protein n=1 Tax=Picocystis salinarum TaxID=88271 RepID=A0A7S3UI32_9CHLO